MELFWQELTADWPELGHFLTLVFRLILAALVGAVPGLQREMKSVLALTNPGDTHNKYRTSNSAQDAKPSDSSRDNPSRK